MADVNNADMVAGATSVDAAESAPATKKTRKPRRPKTVASDLIISDAPVKKTRAKRGSNTEAVAEAKPEARKQVKRTPRTASAVKTAPTAVEPLDDIASLLKLEEENKTLRKQLFDKLHAENADLRKRLG